VAGILVASGVSQSNKSTFVFVVEVGMFRVRVRRKAWSRRDDDKAVELVSLANAGQIVVAELE